MLRLKVSGMTCEHCVRAITQAVRALPGVEDVSVDLAQGDVMVAGMPDERAVREAIAEKGYDVQTVA
jgi:copper chaperone